MGTVVTQLYNLTDSVIVGNHIGAEALAAVSATSPTTNIINLFLIGIVINIKIFEKMFTANAIITD